LDNASDYVEKWSYVQAIHSQCRFCKLTHWNTQPAVRRLSHRCFAVNSSILSVDGTTCLIPFESSRIDLSNGISHIQIVSIFRL
jgi:hypothetical protein